MMRRALGRDAVLIGFAALAFAACTSVASVQNDPVNHRRLIRASGYTLDGCQAKMNELAGTNVQMAGSVSQIGVSLLNFGLLPFYVCHGFAPP